MSYPIPLYLTAGPPRTMRGTAFRIQEYIALLDYGQLTDRFDVMISPNGNACAWVGDTLRPNVREARRRFVEVCNAPVAQRAPTSAMKGHDPVC